jgi:hypothetical protein
MLLRIGYDVSLTDVASYCIFFLASTTLPSKYSSTFPLLSAHSHPAKAEAEVWHTGVYWH